MSTEQSRLMILQSEDQCLATIEANIDRLKEIISTLSIQKQKSKAKRMESLFLRLCVIMAITRLYQVKMERGRP